MSLYDSSGSAFYSEQYPNMLAPEESPAEQHASAESAFAQDSGNQPATANPVYTRYSDTGEDTFAPLPNTMDPSFQPASEQPKPVQTGFQFQPWMLLAAGALFVLWMRGEHE